MSNECIDKFGEIIVGSEAEGTIFLVDENGKPFSIAPYDSGNLVFCNEKGDRTVIALVVPGTNPDKGQLPYLITAIQTAFADCKWVNADVELYLGATLKKVVPLNDKFKIVERNCPPIAP